MSSVAQQSFLRKAAFVEFVEILARFAMTQWIEKYVSPKRVLKDLILKILYILKILQSACLKNDYVVEFKCFYV
ncbi:hypothetical protein EAE92_05085 [Photorhabdus hainanensis]|nr:hypothetical protein [Photorhabdus hainanensis]